MRLTLFAVLLLPAPALAWSKPGHMVTGAIAYAVLEKDDPAALAKAVELLKQTPQYARDWKPTADGLPEAERGLYLFMMAARWADDIRGDPRYDRPPWHYIGLPFKPPGQPAWLTEPLPAPVNAVTAFERNREAVRAAPDADERAVALCWLFHLVGDIHQPLHAGGLVTRDWPLGDRGGNSAKVRPEPTGRAVNLHYYWDGLITNTDDYRQCKNRATELRLRPAFARERLAELAAIDRFEDWARTESSPLARSVVYRGGTLPVGLSDADAPPLPADYAKQAQAVGERRAVLAGYRLAAVVRAAMQ
jgi:hypothetical protein